MIELSPQDKKNIVGAVLTTAILLSIFLLAKTIGEVKAYPSLGKNPNQMNAITVNGTGEVFAVPDIATISFTVKSEAKSIADAQKSMNEKINKAIEVLESEGVDKKDIKTTGYTGYPKYEQKYETAVDCFSEYCPPMPTKSVISGYETNQTISVKVRNTDSLGKITDALGKVKITEINGPNFSIDDEDAVKAEARDKAIVDAKAKAEAIASGLGVRLTRVVSFYEDQNSMPMYGGDMAMGGSMMKESSANIPMGENQIISNVSITYEIR